MIDSLIKNALSGEAKSLLGDAASNLSIQPDQMNSLFDAIGPAIADKMQADVSSPDAIQGLLGGIDLGSLAGMLSSSADLSSENALATGRGFLDSILGEGGDVGDLLETLSQKSGIATSSLSSFVPMILTAVASKLAQGDGLGSLLQATFGGDGAAGGGLTSLIDQDGDGEIVDDLLNAAKKLF